MSPQEMVDRYVHEVARRLPWHLRGDVSSELRDLLLEQLAATAEEEAEDYTESMLIKFGSPAEVATRYYAAPPVIDPIDSRRFWQVAAAFLLVLAVLRYSLPSTAPEVGSWSSAENGLAAFWFAILGVLTLVFWAFGAIRRRITERRGFDPRRLAPVHDPDVANRLGYGAAVVLFTLGTFILAVPARLLDYLSGGSSSPEALAAFAYDPTFLEVRAPLVMVGLSLAIILFAWAGILGRWTALTRRLEFSLSVFINGLLLWSMNAGPIFSATPTDSVAKLAMALIVAGTLLKAWWKLDRLRASRAQFHILSASQP